MATPPKLGSTAANSRASLIADCPTTALRGNTFTAVGIAPMLAAVIHSLPLNFKEQFKKDYLKTLKGLTQR
jgi:hypothetical protein